MNSTLKLMLFSTLAISSTAMTTTCESCFTYSTQMFGPIDLPSLKQEATESRNSSSYADDASYELPLEVMAQLPVELAAMIASADKSPERYVDRTEESVRYYATYAADSCSSKPAKSFESWEESFESMKDCCENMFSWDVDGCMRR
jgi:hypothetical protein